MRKFLQLLAFIIPVLCLFITFVFAMPFLQEHFGWRLEALQADIKYALNPPQQVVFSPSSQTTADAPPTLPPTVRPSPTPTISLVTAAPTQAPTSTPLPTLTPTPLPAQAKLTGIQHEYQMWNNCGPANLAMALSYWGWKGDQRQTAAFLKPNQRDKNVMPYEMESFVEQKTDLAAALQVGGDLQMLKAFISAGYPVLVEKGFEGVGFDGWMGHYEVVSGYDDAKQLFTVQDSYKGPDLQVSYADMLNQWRAFNNTYLVIYPKDQKDQVLQILGLQAYDNFNHHFAADTALAETSTLTGRDLFFAWFNRGSSLVGLQDYTGAAAAFDTAFANYGLVPEAQRPWRMMWYQTGPYFAYYYTGRYQDVINLATETISAANEPVLEESFYWRAKAEEALVQVDPAVKDLQQCLVAHPEFQPCLDELKILGVEPK